MNEAEVVFLISVGLGVLSGFALVNMWESWKRRRGGK